MEHEQSNKFLVPAAILVAGMLIAGAIYAGGAKPSSNPSEQVATVDVPAYNDLDHMRNGATAELNIVEYSDTECPFCKVFHNTLRQVINDYGTRVSWVYRQFPIPQLHQRAMKEAVATECVAELGGQQAFWSYLDKIFDATGSNDSLDPALLPKFASDLGINSAAFTTCLTSGKYDDKIKTSIAEAIKAGARGTPYSVIQDRQGKTVGIINGAEPIESVKAKIDALLK